MGAGGRPLEQLRRLAERFPIPVHGVGLSIGGEKYRPSSAAAPALRLAQPGQLFGAPVSSTHDGAYFNDLLPRPCTAATLALVCNHIDAVQTALGRWILLDVNNVYVSVINRIMTCMPVWTPCRCTRLAKSILVAMMMTATITATGCSSTVTVPGWSIQSEHFRPL